MKLIYIAGPFRGDVASNVNRAQNTGDELAKAGIAFICPHSNGSPHDFLDLPDEYWLSSTMEILRRCDAVMLVAGWQNSSGTRDEIKAAVADGKPVFKPNEIKECIDWAMCVNA